MYLDLQNLSGAKLTQALKSIPAQEETLELRGNELYTRDGSQLREIFSSFPASTRYVGLGTNNLNQIGHLLIETLPLLPQGTQTLVLDHNDLGLMNPLELKALFQTFPKDLQDLNLSWNELSYKKDAIGVALKELPILNKIDLAWNNLGKLSGIELANFLNALPLIKEIDLRFNGLGSLATDELSMALKKISAGTIRINLSGNNLEKRKDDEIEQILNSLPEGAEVILSHTLNKSGFFTKSAKNNTHVPNSINENNLNYF